METYLNRLSTFSKNYNGHFTASWQSCTAGANGCFNLKHDNVQLITAKEFDGTTTGKVICSYVAGVCYGLQAKCVCACARVTLGLAWIGTMCDSGNSAGVNELKTGLSAIPDLVGTVTHEMGHNFGAQHDSQGNTCAQSGKVMAAVSGQNAATQW